MKIQNINFKKAMIIFSAIFLIFTIISTSVEIANGRWDDAISYQQNRFDSGQNRAGFGRSHEREGRFGRSNHSQIIQIDQSESANELITPPQNVGDRVIFSVARIYVRMTSPEFNIMNVFNTLLHLAFFALITLWVYVDSKKREYNAFLWTGLTLFLHVFGLLGYLVFRESKRIISKRTA